MNVLCRMKAVGALVSAVPRSIGPRRYTHGYFRKALGGLGPRRYLGTAVRRARVLDGRGDHGVPDGAGQRRLGRAQRSAHLVVDAVV